MLSFARPKQPSPKDAHGTSGAHRSPALPPILLLQRTIGNRGVQRLLRVSHSSDPHEREADRTADQVVSGPGKQVQAKPVSGSAPALPAAPAFIDDILRGPNHPLEDATRRLMEPGFGHNFEHVRVHTGAAAAESARQIGARAYTFGRDIVFGEGQYEPASGAGRRLLAHELAHVAQQQDGLTTGVVQRAEVDDRSCAGLTDIEKDVDKKVNDEIKAARAAVGTTDIKALAKEIDSRLGGGGIGKIETWVTTLPTKKQSAPPLNLASSKYESVGGTLAIPGVVAPKIKVHGICIGSDKLGHFFGEGLLYFAITQHPSGTTAVVEAQGRALEIQGQGLGVAAIVGTGVFSNADLAANRAGLKFYQDLQANPAKLKFAIKDYIGSDWNEMVNPSFYDTAKADAIWANLLRGKWRGPFTTTGSKPTDSQVELTVSGTSVSGTFRTPPPPKKAVRSGTITNGALSQVTTTVSGTDVTAAGGPAAVSATPVKGISITFDWGDGATAGKGIWTSIDEQNLTGTWGAGTSTTNGGTWNLKKV
jgi:hypothetical protein